MCFRLSLLPFPETSEPMVWEEPFLLPGGTQASSHRHCRVGVVSVTRVPVARDTWGVGQVVLSGEPLWSSISSWWPPARVGLRLISGIGSPRVSCAPPPSPAQLASLPSGLQRAWVICRVGSWKCQDRRRKVWRRVASGGLLFLCLCAIPSSVRATGSFGPQPTKKMAQSLSLTYVPSWCEGLS